MKALTEKQQQILKFIAEFSIREEMAPTVYELAAHFNIKTSTVFAHLRALQRKGKLTRTSQARSIKLTDRANTLHSKFRGVTIKLEDASDKSGEYVISGQFCADIDICFAMKVSDDAMRDFGIFAGDVVLLGTKSNIRPGDLVAAEVKGKTLLRNAYPRSRNRLELRPGNPDFPAQTYCLDNVKIRGVVVGLQREY